MLLSPLFNSSVIPPLFPLKFMTFLIVIVVMDICICVHMYVHIQCLCINIWIQPVPAQSFHVCSCMYYIRDDLLLDKQLGSSYLGKINYPFHEIIPNS